ncbi:MAG: fructose-bisphosphatase [Deltaproteobacteria bacterium CG2_30_63_29]|nr:MAG: fructose-bisphosphatase [Deltaproteobacteria bacterium CG2_30_63_29]PIV98527.1 MAG: class 1 fructose-bisphosphatase [Deltaproteobacteria bacterium CG17_big_fil_post_rev_8_21_14_2_50_63_7]PJB35817.1 MAG: class 1 fructose-bisphosphatase [Deltaproteobacteria bacterium CG_4_9_14_3_um_filter_63_12]
MKRIVTVQRHLIETQHLNPDATGKLTAMLWDLTIAFKIISRAVNQAGLINMRGEEGQINTSGDSVKKLDRYAEDVIYNGMNHGGHVCCMASEEEPQLITIPDQYQKGKYVLTYDPLDGSSNIDANVSVGTIFSIHHRLSESGNGTLADALQPGNRLVAAGYVVYGSSTMMVYSTGNGVHGFTLDPSVGEFLLSHESFQIPRKGKIYSVNEGHSSGWDEPTRRYVEYLKTPEAGPYSGRYIGSMVADVHRTLLYGGIFMHPRDYRRDEHFGQGKLRLLYEAAPMAFLVEQAGGIATTGDERVLDIMPTDLHQRVPLVLGSPADIETYQKFMLEARA